MIDEVCGHLRSLDEFRDLTPQDVQLETLQTLAHSEVYRVRIAAPPASLILKKSGLSDDAGLAERERRFYRHIAPLLPGWLVPRCRLVVHGDSGGYLVIDDLSGSHQPGDNEHPTRRQCRRFVEALAVLHGRTASDSTIRERWVAMGAGLPAETLEQRLGFVRLALEPFLQAMRKRADGEVDLLQSALLELDEQIKEVKPHTPCLVHGDAHFANALFAADAQACLIDWAMPMIAFGEIDLAHALALNLPAELRRAWEEEMVSAYLDQLAASGAPVARDGFYERYRLGILYSLASPLFWWWSGVPEARWRAGLTNALAALRDLGLAGGRNQPGPE